MTGRTASGTAAPSMLEANLDAFFRHRGDVAAPRSAALSRSLSRLRGSDDPIVAFGRLPQACVPDFADGCQVELADGTGPLFRAVRPVSPGEDPDSATARSEHVLVTPFRAVSVSGDPSYAGVVTHWWIARAPTESDAVIADLMVTHLTALVEQERLMAAVARAEDRAATLALGSISGRTIGLAVGIVMHQNGLQADDAEHMLRQLAGRTATDLHQVAAGVVRSGSLQPVSPPGCSVAGELSTTGVSRRCS
jgi:hypothetical protein